MTPTVQLSRSFSLLSSSVFLSSSRISAVSFLISPSLSDVTALTGQRTGTVLLFLAGFFVLRKRPTYSERSEL